MNHVAGVEEGCWREMKLVVVVMMFDSLWVWCRTQQAWAIYNRGLMS